MSAMDTDLVIKLRLTFKLTDSLAQLLAVLIEQPVVSNEMIIDRNITVAPVVGIHRLRKALRRAGFNGRIEVGAKMGYWIEPDVKAAITQLTDMYNLPEKVSDAEESV